MSSLQMVHSTHAESVSSTLPGPASQGNPHCKSNMLMASKSWLTHPAALMLLLLPWSDDIFCDGLAVDPPDDLVILDPGHLGRLDITWSPPASLINMTECPKLYHLEYFDAYHDSWTAIRTLRTSYSAQFDLMKDVRVRVYTLLSGPCTDGSTIKSTRYTEVVQKAPSKGVAATAVQDFICLYHNMEYIECNWQRNPKIPANSQLRMYFWHKALEQAEECPEYVLSGGFRSGCTFTGKSLPSFTNINFCLNGSSHEGPLKPTFISLQTQNQVKPGITAKLYLQTSPDAQLQMHWERPAGAVPGDCLEWEVEHNQEGPDGKIVSWQRTTTEKTLTLPSIHERERICLRVRSKLSKYCAAKSFWSEWSHAVCHPVLKMAEVTLEPHWDMFPVYVYLAVAIIAILVLSLCVWAALRLRSRQDEKIQGGDSLLTTLFARSSDLTVAVA